MRKRDSWLSVVVHDLVQISDGGARRSGGVMCCVLCVCRERDNKERERAESYIREK